MDTIYQEIWNADQLGNGVPALRPGEATSDTVGYVVVDERAVQVGTDHKVLSKVHIPESKLKTYRLCERIFDNYALERAATEKIWPEETQEELDFIDAILPTEPIQVAREHMERSLNLSISDQMLASMIKETWFTFGRAGAQRDASGFEHVFVGEQAKKHGKIGGYHFWYKYFLDDGGRTFDIGDGVDRMEYLGTRYQKAEEPDKGILIPEVVTLSLIWDAPGGDGNSAGRTLEKPIGGFFVGLSPEGMVALGLVRCRTRSGKEAKINGAIYDLDLHRLDNMNNSIRTFFPRFKRADVVVIDPPEPGPTPPPVSPLETGSFKIIAGMINPENPEGGREFLQIINTSNSLASLKEWRIVAPNGVGFELSDISVAPGEIFKFQIPRNDGILRNKGGEIQFFSPDQQLVQVCAYTLEQGRQEGAPILFS